MLHPEAPTESWKLRCYRPSTHQIVHTMGSNSAGRVHTIHTSEERSTLTVCITLESHYVSFSRSCHTQCTHCSPQKVVLQTLHKLHKVTIGVRIKWQAHLGVLAVASERPRIARRAGQRGCGLDTRSIGRRSSAAASLPFLRSVQKLLPRST